MYTYNSFENYLARVEVRHRTLIRKWHQTTQTQLYAGYKCEMQKHIRVSLGSHQASQG